MLAFRHLKWWLIFASALLLKQARMEVYAVQAKVEIEETVCTSADPKNGAGALWCYGAPLMVRIDKRVFVSAMEISEGISPLCNTRPRIFVRNEDGWHTIWQADDFREREPCPIICFQDGTFFLSINPLIEVTEARRGLCNSHLLRFSTHNLNATPKVIQPNWVDKATFTEHSYRGITSDSARGEILLLNIDADTGEQCWSFCDASGNWIKNGRIRFPIRACYPQVALHNHTAHVLAIGDIVEPNQEWRRYKFEKTKRDWDYVFRRLFYTWTPNVATTDFTPPIEIDNVDTTGGHISNLDLWVDNKGNAHVLYLKQLVVQILRDEFFPHLHLLKALEYCIIARGKVISRSTLLVGGEDISGDVPIYARFHATLDGRLLVVYACEPPAMKIMQILLRRTEATKIELHNPLGIFFTATERGGSKPSDVIDLFGIADDPHTLRYVRVKLKM